MALTWLRHLRLPGDPGFKRDGFLIARARCGAEVYWGDARVYPPAPATAPWDPWGMPMCPECENSYEADRVARVVVEAFGSCECHRPPPRGLCPVHG